MTVHHRQNGMTLISWILLIVLIGFVGLFGFKLFPIYLEYYSVRSALKTVAQNVQSEETPAQIRVSISNLFDVNSINDIQPDQVKITADPDSNKVILTLDYDQRTNFLANIDLLVHFHVSYQANPH